MNCAALRGRGTGTSISSCTSPGMRRQHQDAVGEKDRLVEIVGDEDDGDVDLAPDFQQMRLHRAARLRIERAERLVHQQDARLIGERAHDRHALLHAARQLMRIAVGEFLEADQLQPLQRLRLGLVACPCR